MLSVQQCRSILGKNCSLADSEIETLRDQLYGLADIALRSLPEQVNTETVSMEAAAVSENGDK